LMGLAVGLLTAQSASPGGPLPTPLPLFPADNWWNLDISSAPVDPNSASYINFIGPARRMHPDFGGTTAPGSVEIYGFPYIVVGSDMPKRTVEFQYSDESDGVNHAPTRASRSTPSPIRRLHKPTGLKAAGLEISIAATPIVI
jgi:hypothetical protein